MAGLKSFGVARAAVLVAALAILSLGPRGSAPAEAQSPADASEPVGPSGSLRAFRSDRELSAYLLRLREEAEPPPSPPPPPPPPPSPPPPPPSSGPDGAVMVTGSRIPQPNLTAVSPVTAVTGEAVSAQPQSITNTQEANVDEGGIVKVHGQNLVILRRGRLFTVSLADGVLRPVDSINAFPPGVSGSGDWYDEMLVAGDRVIVIGYSYARGGTEINRFRISREGRLRFE
ncbi:MAG: beta-propeller domain-containing protein, partial [Allosphingosinicella sp.]